MALDSLYRNTVLGVAGWAPLQRFLRGRGLSLGVRRFVAGETAGEAAAVVRRLERENLASILDLLGEFVTSERAARQMAGQIMAGLDELAGVARSPAMSVKPTQLGLAVDFELALENALLVAGHARKLGFELCLDMESSEYVDGTLALYRELRERGHDNVSTVLQAYLRRTGDDLEALLAGPRPPALRIVKGAYREPREVAFGKKEEIAEAFRGAVTRLVAAGGKANIATHDARLIADCQEILRASPEPRYEFQLLYGVRPALQRSLRDRGHPVRIYVPYGLDWYGYFSRRLAERPENLLFVLRGLSG